MASYRAGYDSPIGTIDIVGTEHGITEVRFADRRAARRQLQPHPVLTEAIGQLAEYFEGRRKEFSLKLQLRGTDFERNAWQKLRRIPYGRTASYREVAHSLGKPGAARAVGRANHRNPIAIVIPCHRVIGADGRLVGYGGGLWRKEWLLTHEKMHSKASKRR